MPDHQHEQYSNSDHLLLSNFIQTQFDHSTIFNIPQEKRVHELLAEHKITSPD